MLLFWPHVTVWSPDRRGFLDEAGAEAVAIERDEPLWTRDDKKFLLGGARRDPPEEAPIRASE